jgi:hypothetical protein
MTDETFFIGWARRVPPRLRGFLGVVSLGAVGGAALLGLTLSASVDDPGGGSFDWASGEQTLQGSMTRLPYPLLHLPASPDHPRGHAVLLSGVGKNGVVVAPDLEGGSVEATGVMIRRGSIDMMQVGDDVKPRAGGQAVPPAKQLGRWRLVGEICDGKCWTGAMRPGGGIAHKACAQLCLDGEIPPVLVTTAPVEGTTFLLLADADGGPMPAALRPLAGVRLSLDGDVEQRGDVLVLRIAPNGVRRL